jgi:Peptidase C13 family
MRKTLALLSWMLIAAPGAQAQDTVDVVEAQRALIDAQVARFDGDPDPRGRVYFLGFAGFGGERVFAEEIKLAAKRVGERYGAANRSVLLLNDQRDLTTWPLASQSSLRYSLREIARVMNPEEDVLFLALSSHGSRNSIAVSNTGMNEQSLSARALAKLLEESGIRWRVIVVSACFSGTFVKPLADNHTIVITAAAKNRTSFGCSDQRDLTYFGESFYRDALPRSTYLRVAFEAARKDIRERELAEEFTPSQPQGYFGLLIEEKLRAIEQARSPSSLHQDQGR